MPALPTSLALACCLLVSALSPSCASAQRWPSAPRSGALDRSQRGTPTAGSNLVFQRGYREGYREGERDGRQRRSFNVGRHDAYRDGDRGYNRDEGDRQRYRDDYRNGFEVGYQAGYSRVRGSVEDRGRGRGSFEDRRGSFQEPAYARGYADGFDKGRDDWSDRDRYDPVRHREYRSGDNGFSSNYGNRELYRRYYREGFREGYEDGYRGSDRRGRR
jgi:hypothetical protein